MSDHLFSQQERTAAGAADEQNAAALQRFEQAERQMRQLHQERQSARLQQEQHAELEARWRAGLQGGPAVPITGQPRPLYQPELTQEQAREQVERMFPHICTNPDRAPGTIPAEDCDCPGCTRRREDGVQPHQPWNMRPIDGAHFHLPPPVQRVEENEDAADLGLVEHEEPEISRSYDAYNMTATFHTIDGRSTSWALGRFSPTLRSFLMELVIDNYPERTVAAVTRAITLRWTLLPEDWQHDCPQARSRLERAAEGLG